MSASIEHDSNSMIVVHRCLFFDSPVVALGREGKTGQLEGSIRPSIARYSTPGTHVQSRGDIVSGIGLVLVKVLHDAVESLKLGTVVAGPSQQKKKGWLRSLGVGWGGSRWVS